MKPSLFSRLNTSIRKWLKKPAAALIPTPGSGNQGIDRSFNPLDEPVPEQDVVPHYELAPSTRRIIVACGSCGVRHELDAVCALCGTPLCKDERNCRHQKMDMNLGKTIIVCQNCK